ncbi:MAG: response regulator [Chlorobi bacterium]|nr:response regulator [Chlorobiota bacterium]
MSRILIIEDDPDFREMLREMLERSGYKVSIAVDGSDGVRRAEMDMFDLVITDIIMPEKEGLETILELRKRIPGCKIFAISGGGRSSAGNYLKTAEYFGALRTFQKPFDREELLEAIRMVLGN